MVSNSYICLISTFSLHGKKGDAAKSIFKMCVHFQNIKFGVQAPLVEIELTVWQKNWGGAKAWSAISYILLISTFSLQPTAFWNVLHFQNIKFGVQAPLVEIELTVWQKKWAKAWSAISYILLISTFSLHGKKRNAANSIFWMCFHFQNIKFDVQIPLVEIVTNSDDFLLSVTNVTHA